MGHRVAVTTVSDLPEGRAKHFDVEGTAIILCKVGAEIFALDGICSHALKPLDGARVRQGILMCPHHGARFDVKTGALVAAPALTGIGSYQVHVSGDVVEVSIDGDSA